ncbi:MAG: cupin domain-containing protein [Arenimonas sp.]
MQRPIINLDQLEPRLITQAPDESPEKYRGAEMAEVAEHIGAQRLGYSVTIVPPEKTAFPFHNHFGNEEMFFILEGEGEVRIGENRYPIRSGDFIACPVGGKLTAHQIINTSNSKSMKYIGVSTTQTPDMVQYPDSGKTGAAHYLADNTAIRIRNFEENNAGYWEGE